MNCDTRYRSPKPIREWCKITKKEYSELKDSCFYPKGIELRKARRIAELRCASKVCTLLAAGCSELAVAHTIKQSGELLNVKINVVRQYVAHYKAVIFKKLLNVSNSESGLHADKIEILQKMKLFRRQSIQRLGEMVEIEQKRNLSFRGTAQTVNIIYKINQDIHFMELLIAQAAISLEEVLQALHEVYL